MSLYRKELLDGTVWITKRKLLRFWIWSRNRSLEEPIIKMRNQRAKLRQQLAHLDRAIPKMEKQLGDDYKKLAEIGGISMPWRAWWSSQREPPALVDPNVKLEKKKKVTPPKPEPTVLAHLVAGNSKK